MMKILFQYTLLFTLLAGLYNCQVLKEPAAKVMSTTLHTPEIDSTENNLPMADYNLKVKDLNGTMIDMEDYRGKVIFLNFWATWCMPCVAELPSINKLYQTFKNDTVVFLLISNEQMKKVKNYHERKGYEVPFHIIDQDGNIPNLYYSPNIPTTFIIDKEGRIVKYSVGAENWDDEQFIESIKKML